jgi:hypothetical protein
MKPRDERKPRGEGAASRPRRVEPPEPPGPRDWAMVYTRAGHRLAWLIIEGAPHRITRADIAQALEDTGTDQKYSPGVGGRIAILPRPRWGELEGLDQANRIAWDALIPASKALVVRTTGAEHARLSRAARRKGKNLQTWALEALRVAADAALEPAPPPSAIAAQTPPSIATARPRSADLPPPPTIDAHGPPTEAPTALATGQPSNAPENPSAPPAAHTRRAAAAPAKASNGGAIQRSRKKTGTSKIAESANGDRED